jgi:hypothetical protein
MNSAIDESPAFAYKYRYIRIIARFILCLRQVLFGIVFHWKNKKKFRAIETEFWILQPVVRLQTLNNKYLSMRVKLPRLLLILDKRILHCDGGMWLEFRGYNGKSGSSLSVILYYAKGNIDCPFKAADQSHLDIKPWWLRSYAFWLLSSWIF